MLFPLSEASSKNASKGRDFCHAEKGSHREGGEQVLSRVLQSALCNPQKEWEASVDHQLSIVDRHPAKENFHMEAPSNPRLSIQRGDKVIFVYLTDALLHVPIHPSSRKFLRFCYQDEIFQFRINFELTTMYVALMK